MPISTFEELLLSQLFFPALDDPLKGALESSLKGIPKFLFRGSDIHSSSRTTPTEVCSAAMKNFPDNPMPDLLQQDKLEAANNLCRHLAWGCEDDCNLVSWTSSLLCAIQHALHRFKNGNNPYDYSLTDIHVMVVDTEQLVKRGAIFARDLQLIGVLKDYAQGGRQTLLREFNRRQIGGIDYYGEYISQGRLVIGRDGAIQVSLRKLIDNGLYDLLPDLEPGINPVAWPDGVLHLRAIRGLARKRLPQEDVGPLRGAIRTAKQFGQFSLPIALMLICLSRKVWLTETIYDVLQEEYKGAMAILHESAHTADEFPLEDEIDDLTETFHIGDRTVIMPEIHAVVKIVEDIKSFRAMQES
jgi:hypothetical protein